MVFNTVRVECLEASMRVDAACLNFQNLEAFFGGNVRGGWALYAHAECEFLALSAVL
jgi:hypothetical protein